MTSLSIEIPSRSEDVARWFRGGLEGVKVKENAARTVWRVPVGAAAFYIKRFPRSLTRDRAQVEARMLRAMAALGLPCPPLIGTARDSDGSYVITEEIPEARTLHEVLREDVASRRVLLPEFAALLRRLHDSGIDHRDLHTGNVLVTPRGMAILDVHRARRLKKISLPRRMEAVAFTAFSFADQVSRSELIRFFTRYGLATKEDRARAMEGLRRRRERHYRSRDGRCVRVGTAFGRWKEGWYRTGVDLEAVRRWVIDGEQERVKRDGAEGLFRSKTGWFLKRTKPARAFRIWKNAHALSVRAIPTPEVMALGRGWVVGRWIDAPHLFQAIEERWGSLSRAERSDFLLRLALLLRSMHDRGVFHQDLKAVNILVDGRQFVFIDVDRVRIGKEVGERERQFNLAQLNASLIPPLTQADRLRFLHFYFGHRRAYWMRREEWIRRIMRITRARKHRWP